MPYRLTPEGKGTAFHPVPTTNHTERKGVDFVQWATVEFARNWQVTPTQANNRAWEVAVVLGLAEFYSTGDQEDVRNFDYGDRDRFGDDFPHF